MKKWSALILMALIVMTAVFPALAAQPKTTVEIGDYVQMGVYYGEPVLWRCVDIDETGPLMLADRILCLKTFDASGQDAKGSHGRGGGNHSGGYRKEYGSNYWGDSNLRCWLNSSAEAGKVAYLCGNRPDAEHVEYNAYDREAGFLTNFTEKELALMKPVERRVLLDQHEYSDMSSLGKECHWMDSSIRDCVGNYDTAYAETVTDTVFVPDVEQIHRIYQNDELLGGTNYYIGHPTVSCVQHAEYESPSLSVRVAWWTWLSTPYDVDNIGSSVRRVSFDGTINNTYATYGNGGVRPAFYLASGDFVAGSGSMAHPYVVEMKEMILSLTIGDKTVYADGVPVYKMDVPAQIKEDRTLVPLRAISESFGCEVEWDGEAQLVTVTRGALVITLTIGDTTVYANGKPVYTMDVPAQVENDRTLVPLRAISESFGCKVDWEEAEQLVTITVPAR